MRCATHSPAVAQAQGMGFVRGSSRKGLRRMLFVLTTQLFRLAKVNGADDQALNEDARHVHKRLEGANGNQTREALEKGRGRSPGFSQASANKTSGTNGSDHKTSHALPPLLGRKGSKTILKLWSPKQHASKCANFCPCNTLRASYPRMPQKRRGRDL